MIGFACEINNIDIRLSDCSGINLASIIYWYAIDWRINDSISLRLENFVYLAEA